jgi:6-phosphogluconolactonase
MHPYADDHEAAQACCDYILAALAAAKALRKKASLAVSGGSTPKLLFQAMAAQSFDWTGVHWFFVDERCVPPADSQSNYRLANENFLQLTKFPMEQVHRVSGEIDPQLAAKQYAEDVEKFFGGGAVRFDVMQHGMGPDAHTASLFPGEPLIHDMSSVTAAVYNQNMKQWRVTLMPKVIQAARHTAFLVCGADKSEAIVNVLTGQHDPMQYPAQIAALPNGDREIAWFVDDLAATDYFAKTGNH